MVLPVTTPDQRGLQPCSTVAFAAVRRSTVGVFSRGAHSPCAGDLSRRLRLPWRKPVSDSDLLASFNTARVSPQEATQLQLTGSANSAALRRRIERNFNPAAVKRQTPFSPVKIGAERRLYALDAEAGGRVAIRPDLRRKLRRINAAGSLSATLLYSGRWCVRRYPAGNFHGSFHSAHFHHEYAAHIMAA